MAVPSGVHEITLQVQAPTAATATARLSGVVVDDETSVPVLGVGDSQPVRLIVDVSCNVGSSIFPSIFDADVAPAVASPLRLHS